MGAGCAAATLVAVPGQAAGPVLNGTVGPGFTISLTQNGAPVTKLAPGEYTVSVGDNSAIHNFHLFGPGVEQKTAIEYTGNTSWDVTFSAGTYNFVCDAHAYDMEGTFTVGSGSTTSSAVVESVRVTATGRRSSRVVAVRVDLRRAATVRARLVRGGKTLASLRRAVGTRATVVRLRVPAAAPAGRYTLELVLTWSGASQRVVRVVQLRP